LGALTISHAVAPLTPKFEEFSIDELMKDKDRYVAKYGRTVSKTMAKFASNSMQYHPRTGLSHMTPILRIAP
jgi:hypothetical protein